MKPPRSILVLSGRYHIMSNALIVNNCIISYYSHKNSYFGEYSSKIEVIHDRVY